MSTQGQFNTKSPTIKRILKESHELTSHPTPDFTASPLESNIFEWHFTLRGPPSSPYASGLYHGRIVLPPAYPLRPPSFRFLTPSGRFEVNREICLSISGHHEESWQPAWGIRTALVAIRAFMAGPAKGQLGGMECPDDVRQRFAEESAGYTCPTCARSNAAIMKEVEEECAQLEEKGEKKEEQVPEELRLAYREELDEKKTPEAGSSSQSEQKSSNATQSTSTSAPPQPAAASPPTSTPPAQPPLQPTRTTQPRLQVQTRPPLADTNAQAATEIVWIDGAIYTVLGALAFMILKKFFV